MRWLVLPLAMGVAAISGYVILSADEDSVSSPPPEPSATTSDAPVAASARAPGTPVEEPHGEIREKSRERLLEILREAEAKAE